MKTILENEKFNVKLEASDWRYSAAIVGLEKYFRFHRNLEFEICDEYILYNSADITQDKYLEFVEYHYSDELHHKIIEQLLFQDNPTEEQIKLINERMAANSILKKFFGKLKFDGTNAAEIMAIINDNRTDIIRETYRNKKNMYANFNNTYQMFNEDQDVCRLVGYCIDKGRKGKSISYNFNIGTFVGNDVSEFDFIPFAFTGDREAFFINDNYSIDRLISTNMILKQKVKMDMEEKDQNNPDVRRALFKGIIETSDFIDFDVEIILKDRDKAYYETLFIRKQSIDILRQIKDYRAFCFSYKITDNYYVNIQKEVINCILNNVFTDKLIEMFLKEHGKSYLVKQLININILIRGGEAMNKSMKNAYACAKKVSQTLEENKINSYRQKLTSAIIFNDYDRVYQILVQLSNYSNIQFDFAYDLFEDFENNKEVVYAFIISLSKWDSSQDKNQDKKQLVEEK